MNRETDRVCQICRQQEAHEVDVADDDGAAVAYACPDCIGKFREGARCSICSAKTSGEYQIIVNQSNWMDSNRPLCSECRALWLFSNTKPIAERLARIGVTRFTAENGRGMK